MAITRRLMTADELFHLPDDGYRHELVSGELRKMTPAGGQHGAVIMNVAVPLGQHIKAEQLGVIFGAETGFVLTRDPDTVRAPDVAFVRRDRIPAGELPVEFWPGAPDLAVEVLSPDDRPREVAEKIRAWLEGGTRAVWVVDARRRTVTIHHPGQPPRVLSETDVLEDHDIVPGFRLPVADIFTS